MNLFELSTKKPLPIHEGSIHHVAFDGCFHYFPILCQEKILKTRGDFTPIEAIFTKRDYHCLCYDSTSECFWGTIKTDHTRIFQLDARFNEVDCISLEGFDLGLITSLSHQVCEDGLVIGFSGGIVVYHKESGTTTSLPSLQGMVTCVVAICPAYLVVTRIGSAQTIHTLWQDGTSLKEQTLTDSPAILDLIFNPCSGSLKVDKLEFFLRNQRCYPHLCELPVTSHDLGFTPCLCNKKLCSCCGGGASVNDVLESVALVEAALSHILNAEGEKLQKIIAV
ncbi:MAG: hypothetical protein R3Y07_05835, partial [Eubacteriales bacterium]